MILPKDTIAFATGRFLSDNPNCPVSLLPLRDNVVANVAVIQFTLSLENQGKKLSKRKHRPFGLIILCFWAVS